MEEVTIPLPTEDKTPPVTKMNLTILPHHTTINNFSALKLFSQEELPFRELAKPF